MNKKKIIEHIDKTLPFFEEEIKNSKLILFSVGTGFMGGMFVNFLYGLLQEISFLIFLIINGAVGLLFAFSLIFLIKTWKSNHLYKKWGLEYKEELSK